MASKANIYIDQGLSYETTIQLQDDDGNNQDLTGYSATAKLRKHYSSSNSTSFTTSITTGTGEVTFSMNAATTAGLTSGRYVYDVELNDGGSPAIITRVVEGMLFINPGVTKSAG